MTTRDEVWNEIIETLVEEGRFKLSDLDIDESKRHTVSRVCREMEDMGYLYRREGESKTWRAGKLAKSLLNLEPKAEVMADLED